MNSYTRLVKSVGDKESAQKFPQQIEETPGIEKTTPYTLLFVDDEVNVLKALRRTFLEENYLIMTASSGPEALEIMDKNTVHLVISDYKMPGMNGAQLLKLVKETYPETMRIMLTGQADVQAIMGAVHDGAVYKFITKPWNNEDLRLTVSIALRQYELTKENRKLKQINQEQVTRIRNISNRLGQPEGIIGSIFIKLNLITNKDLNRALKEREQDELLTETLVRIGIMTEKNIIEALCEHFNLDYVDLRKMDINPGVVMFLPGDVCERHRMVPIEIGGRELKLAMADPSDMAICDTIAFMTGLKVMPSIACSQDILNVLKRVHGNPATGGDADLIGLSDLEPMEEIDLVLEEDDKRVEIKELIGSSQAPPVARIVNAIISEGIRYKASDIHIEPKAKHTVIRFRIDGVLHDKIKIPLSIHAATASRIKVIAKMDIAERRKPQDGRITLKTGARIVDIRAATMPTINGEKIVMRILDKGASVKKLDDLGMDAEGFRKANNLIKKPQGIIIATGPAGGGTTTTLYALLNEMGKSTRNFETIEDPVEYYLESANQVLVKEHVGLSFASVLRATLRQDPDVIMVGEVRDFETADVVFKASLTGHTVLTTLHTNNAIASISRLIDIGIKPYLIASALEGIVAQRLVRRICPHCRIEVDPDRELMQLLSIAQEAMGPRVYQGKGCDRCYQTGYQGRIGLYEIFIMEPDFRNFVSLNYNESELQNMAYARGMKTLMDDAVSKVKQGITTLEEVLWALGPQIRSERRCNGCDGMIDEQFRFCPYCGTPRKNICRKCTNYLKEGWNICPFCGTTSAE